MKQRLLILAAGAMVAFAACNSGNNEGSYSAAQADSIAKVKGDSIAAALKAQNDSLIAAQAQRTADSLRVADSLFNAGKQTTATNVKKNTKPTKKPTTPPKEEPKKEEPKLNPKDNRFGGQKASNADAKDARFGNDEAKKRTQEENTKAKDARFK